MVTNARIFYLRALSVQSLSCIVVTTGVSGCPIIRSHINKTISLACGEVVVSTFVAYEHTARETQPNWIHWSTCCSGESKSTHYTVGFELSHFGRSIINWEGMGISLKWTPVVRTKFRKDNVRDKPMIPVLRDTVRIREWHADVRLIFCWGCAKKGFFTLYNINLNICILYQFIINLNFNL